MSHPTKYTPHSEVTRSHYEKLLYDVRQCVPSTTDYEEVEELAEEVLRLVCSRGQGSQNNTISKEDILVVKQRLERIFGTPVSPEMENNFLNYRHLITDYVVTADTAEEDGSGDVDVAVGGGPSSSEGSSEEDEVNFLAGNKMSKKKQLKKDKNLEQYAFDGDTVNDVGGALDSMLGETHQRGGGTTNASPFEEGDNAFFLLGDEVDEGGEPFRISFDEVACNLHYVEDSLRRLFPSQTEDKCIAQAQKVLEFLSDKGEDDYTVETQLTAYLSGYDSEEVMSWITDVTHSRWCVVYGLQYGRASSQKAKAAVMDAMQADAAKHPAIEKLYQLLTGREATVLKERPTEEAEEGGSGGSVGPRLQRLDLPSYYFEDERAPHLRVKPTVPEGTRRVTYETHDELVLPPTAEHNRQDALKPMSEFPKWAQSAFPGVKELNPMQSKVYACAFESDENMLVSAPTGAGKTNVATMAMLRVAQLCNMNHHNSNKDTISINLRAMKMVYVAPMKALVQEVVRTFTERLAPLGLTVMELSGDSAVTQQQLLQAQLIVTTPEKWDIVTRKSVELGVASMIKLVIIDEVHLLHNERGPVLEAIVARTLLQQQLRGKAGVRLVGLSATLPNVEDVSSFLQVDRQRGLFVFDSSYRPIPLQQTYCAIKKTRGMSKAITMNQVTYDKVLSAARDGEQTMIFVHSRKETENTAVYLRQRVLQEQRSSFFVQPNSASETAVRECLADTSKDLRQGLRQLMTHGFAIHHAGLSREERETVESLFGAGHIRVLVCTSTLAWGVNLPANQVIIKGTRVFSGAKAEASLLSALDVLQMFGRAGRIGFGALVGRAVIVTTPEDLRYYLCVLNQQLPIESQMMKRVIDMLNAEVVLGHVENTKEGVEWLKKSYLYTRMREVPERYGIRKSPNDPFLLHHLENIIHTALLELQKAKMVEYDVQSRRCGPTAYGRVASFCYVTCASMSVYLAHLSPSMEDVDLFRLFSLSSEFTHITVRGDEQDQLRDLLEIAPIAVRDSRYTPLSKINILLQCYISRKDLVGLPLMSELVYIKDSAQRILRALYEICLIREYGRTARQFLQLYLMVLHRQWSVQSPVRQMRQVTTEKGLRAVLSVLEGTRLTWEEVRQWSPEGLSQKFGDDRRGEIALTLIRHVPHYTVTASVRPLTRGLLYVDVDVTPDFDYSEEVHGWGGREVQVLVELPSGRLLHQEPVQIPLEYMQARETFAVAPIVIPVVDPKPTHVFVRVCSAHYLIAECCAAVSLLNTRLPPIAPALAELHQRPAREEESYFLVTDTLAKYGLDNVAEKLFPFETFHPTQRDVVERLMDYSDNVLVGLPPGGGKTVLAELFVLSFLLQEALREESKDAGQHRVFYVTSNEDVVERRGLSWRMKFEEGLQQQVAHLTRAASVSQPETHRLLRSAPIVVVSAAALVNLVRREDPILRSMTHLIVDHLHLLRSAEGRFLEECIASLNSEPFLANGGTARPRLLGLTYPLITTNELGRWLAVPAAQRFNYGNSYRALQVRMETVDLPGARAREETALLSTLRYLQRPAYAAVPAVCFVPTADLAVRFARRVLLQCRDFIPEVPLNHDVEDEQLALFLAAGVAYLHHGTSLFDTLSVLELLDEPAVHPTSKASLPLILACTYDVAGRLPAAAFVHGFLCPERPTGGLSEEEDGSREVAVVTSSDCTVSETLQMTSRVMQACLLYVRPTRRFMWSNLLNEPLPLESYLRYPSDFRETVNAAVARGVVENRTDVLRVLRAHYFLYHLQSNPNFYGVASLSAGEVGLFASEFADHVTALLEADGCVEVHGGSEDPHAALTSTRRGRAVAHHCIATDSVVQLAERLASLSAPDLTTLWECLTLSSEELAPRNVGEAAKVTDPAEGRALQTLVRCLATLPAVGRLAAHFDKLGEHLKLFALLLAYGTRVLPGMLHYEQTVLQRQEKLQQSPAYSEGNTVQVHPFELAEGIPAAERKLLCDIPLPIALRFTRAVEELLPLVVRVVAAAVETLDGAEHGSAVLSFMRLHQSFYQQRWYADPTAIPPSPSSPRVTDLTVQTAVHTKYEREVLTLSVAATIQHPSATPSGEEESVDHTPYEWWLACWAQAKQKKDSPACLMALRAQEMTPADGTIEDDNHQNNNENWNLRGDLFFPISALKTCTGETDLDAVSITVEIIHKTTPTTHKKIVF